MYEPGVYVVKLVHRIDVSVVLWVCCTQHCSSFCQSLHRCIYVICLAKLCVE